MPKQKTPSGIFEWIQRTCRPEKADSAELRFERMDSQSDESLPEVYQPLDHHNPSHWHHRGMIWDYVLAMGDAERVLDVGPGDGWPSLLLAPHFKEIVGIEPGANRVEVCKANAQKVRTRKAHFEQMSACKMEFKSNSFDGVVAATSVEQTPNPNVALREIHRVLKPGGVFRMTYEALEEMAEPVKEAVSILAGEQGAFLIDYAVTWATTSEERGYLIEVVPINEVNRKRLQTWAQRCSNDRYPHRDPRLERGLAQSIKGLRMAEVLASRFFTLQHFKSATLLRKLKQLGFEQIEQIAGGGWPALQCGQELIHARRVEAAAPLMEEICRGAARVGLGLSTLRHGNVIAVKGRGKRKSVSASKPPVRKKAAKGAAPGPS